MKVFDVLSTMNPDALTSIQLETFSEPIAFGKGVDSEVKGKTDFEHHSGGGRGTIDTQHQWDLVVVTVKG